MAGIIPALVQTLGYGLLVLSVVVPLSSRFFFKKKAGDREHGPKSVSMGPNYWWRANYALVILPCLLVICFHILCILTIGVDGLSVLAIWLQTSYLTWLALVVAIVMIIFSTILTLDFLKVHYVVKWGSEVSYLFLGQDLDNNSLFLRAGVSSHDPLVMTNSIYDQNKWFFDRLSDLEERTVIRYGHRQQDLLGLDELTAKQTIMFLFVQAFLIATVSMIALFAIGTYLELRLSIPAAESALMTAILWLKSGYTIEIVGVILTLLLLSGALIRATTHVQEQLRERLAHRVIEKLPARLQMGDDVLGEITDHSVEQASTRTRERAKRSHCNLLVKFTRIYDVAIYLRVSIPDSLESRRWLKKLDVAMPYNQLFVLRDDFTIWPKDLAEPQH
ncbi:hypothetical protein [Cohaesibacter gelatinilyticus]|uniref:Uncharacterized protein n=1 Tax=Cohaesibacter gelatinilyticus TaxID=372072 RepID=A0A285N913_9HYPH|nr:hypothetical protein [Cohaesibacter gelatinilyticus]SNZ05403.1 hypothetical protein SAMN06265368_0110 [Cohaesibacter gelatinilyticus]